eukprot:410255_1
MGNTTQATPSQPVIEQFLPDNDLDLLTRKTTSTGAPNIQSTLLKDIDEKQYQSYTTDTRFRSQSSREERMYNAVLLNQLESMKNLKLLRIKYQVLGRRCNIFAKFWYCVKDENNTHFFLSKKNLDKMLFVAGKYYAKEEYDREYYYATVRHDAIGQHDPNQLINKGKTYVNPNKLPLFSSDRLDYEIKEEILGDYYTYDEQYDEQYEQYYQYEIKYDENYQYDTFYKLKFPKKKLIFGQGVLNTAVYITKFYDLTLHDEIKSKYDFNVKMYCASRKVLQFYYNNMWYKDEFDAAEQCAILFTYGIFTKINTLRECLYMLHTNFWIDDPFQIDRVPNYNLIPTNWHRNFSVLCQRLGMTQQQIFVWKTYTKKGRYFNKMNCKKFLWLIGNLFVHYGELSGNYSDCIFAATYDILLCFSSLPRLLEILEVHLKRKVRRKDDKISQRVRKKLKALKKDLNVVHYLIKYLHRDEPAYTGFLMDGIYTLSLRDKKQIKANRIKAQREEYSKRMHLMDFVNASVYL